MKRCFFPTLVFFIIFSGCSSSPQENAKLSLKKFGVLTEEFETFGYDISTSKLDNWDEYIDYINAICCNGYRPKIAFETQTARKEIYFFNSCCEKIEYITLRQKNTIHIHNDSIFKNNLNVGSLDSIESVLRRDIENFGRDSKLSQSPDKLIIFVSNDTLKINSFIQTLSSLTKAYERITQDTNIVIWLVNSDGEFC